jgi:LacI family transcriptional regulator
MASTSRDVARPSGVSVRTAFNVVAGRPRVCEGTRRRVLAAVGQLSYRPDAVARALRTGQDRLQPLYLPSDGATVRLLLRPGPLAGRDAR